MAKYCKGCGVLLQNEDKEKVGYVPSLDASFCERCFKMKHYGEVTINMQQGIENEETFKKINAIDAVIYWIVDLFSFEASLIPKLNKKLPDKDIILVLTKRDVLPLTLSNEKICDFVLDRLEEEEIVVKDILLCGNLKEIQHSKKSQLPKEGQLSIDMLKLSLEKWRKERDVIFMGVANVGKSTLLNRLFQDSTLTTSRNPGTTLDLIPIEQEEYTVYDTPGIENHHSILSYLTPKDLKTVIPVKPIRPFVSQIYEDQSFAAGGLARLDVVVQGRASIVGYFSRNVSIHRGKLAKADDLWKNHLNETLVPCIDTSLLTMHTYHAPKMTEDKMDVVIYGLGWFCISGDIEDVYVRVHKGVQVAFRKAMI